MPVRMLNFTQVPPPRRLINGRRGLINDSEEFRDVCLALGAGLRPQEYICVEFAPDSIIRKQMKTPTDALLFAIKKKIKQLGLPYDVYKRGELVTIIGRGAYS